MSLMLWNCFGSDNESIQLWKFSIYDEVWNFSEGIAKIQQRGLYGFVDKDGNVVASSIYEYANDFSEGMALVRKDGKYGFINTKGKEIIP